MQIRGETPGISHPAVERLKSRVRESGRTPDFNNLLAVLRREKPGRPTLFEFILNDGILSLLTGRRAPRTGDTDGRCRFLIDGFAAAGFDAAVIGGWQLNALVFPKSDVKKLASKSLNEGALIFDRESFDAYPWPDPDSGDYSPLERAAAVLPDGMKLVVSGTEGVLETVIALAGFERLCLMLFEDPDLAGRLFEAVGSRLLRYYEIVSKFGTVGACIANDDWGFKTQTLLSPDHLRLYVFPWHQRIAEACHDAGKPVILHSCGNLADVMDDVTGVLGMDGKHSFEDAVFPVEEFYRRWGGRIAVMGGIDMDFLAMRAPGEIRRRATGLLRMSERTGGLAVGSGNSIPDSVPAENFCAMAEAVLDYRSE
jgi:uroporphyrinogen decarboxylase